MDGLDTTYQWVVLILLILANIGIWFSVGPWRR